jgi:predicted nucleic acid-binding protein
VPIVVDASVALAWVMNEDHPGIDSISARIERDELIAPALWWFEVRNGLVVNERRRRLDEPLATGFLRDISRLAVTLDGSPDEREVMALARRHRLTVYDAAYLELALREELPLATLDAALAEAARREGVLVLGDAA